MIEDTILELKHAVQLATLDLSSTKYKNHQPIFLFLNLNCKHLTNLDLSHNVNLRQIIVSCKEKGTKETVLFISNTNLGEINPALIIDPKVNLVKLVANNANFTRFEEISSFKKTLKSLSLQGRTLQRISPLLNEIQELEQLSLRDAGLQEIDGHTFESMKNLTRLDLGGNGIVDIDFETFTELFNLEELELDDNQLTYVNGSLLLEIFPNLKSLNVKNNHLLDDDLLELSTILNEVDVVLKY